MNTNLKPVIWMILLGVLVLSAVLALFERLQDRRGQQSVADIRRTMRAQGFKTDLADFHVTTDAATRARVAMLLAFRDAPHLDPSTEAVDLLPAVSNGIASVLWRQTSLNLGTNPVPWPDLRAILNTDLRTLDAACEAVLSGPVRFDTDANPHIVTLGQQSLSLQNLSQVFAVRSLLQLHDGNPEAAWTNLLAATRLVTACDIEPNGCFQCVQFQMAGVAFANAWQVLQKGNWPGEKLAALQQEWASVIFFTNLVESTAIDYTNDIAICQQESQRHLLAGFYFPEFVGQILLAPARACADVKNRVARGLYGGQGLSADEKGLMLFFQRRALEVRRALQATNWLQMRAFPGATNVVQYKSSFPPANKSLREDHTLDNYMLALEADAEAQRRVLVTAIALERYRGKHGVYPATLDSLAPEFLKTVPVDFMDSQPLRYRLTDDRHFVLYSIGLDCVDDGAKMSDPSLTQLIDNVWRDPSLPTNMDIVWPRPANP